MPTVAEVLEVARGRVRINLDLKELEVVEPTVRLVHESGMLDSVTFISFLPEAWDVLERLTPESPIIHLVDSASALAGLGMGDGAPTMAAGVGVPYGLVGEELVERLHRHGYGVFAWTVDDDAEMRRLIAAGVNGIVTNRPAALARGRPPVPGGAPLATVSPGARPPPAGASSSRCRRRPSARRPGRPARTGRRRRRAPRSGGWWPGCP